MAAPRRQLAEAESPVAIPSSEGDALQLLPEQWRPVMKPFHRYLVEVVATGVALARKFDKHQGNNTVDLITVDDAATRLQVSTGMIRNLIAHGQLEEVRIERCVRIPNASLEALIERNKQRDVRE